MDAKMSPFFLECAKVGGNYMTHVQQCF